MEDIGLSRCCRRNGIPTPPRGHGMKLSPVIPVRKAENDDWVRRWSRKHAHSLNES